MSISIKKIAVLFFVLSFAFQLSAQKEQAVSPAPIIFIYDASGSMWAKLQGKTKMEIATEVLSGAVNNLPENQKIGLVAYGHRKKGDCKDVEFLVETATGSKTGVKQALAKIKPLGMTPLAYSATLVLDKIKDSNIKATIILVTDGIESCDGNICEVVKAAKQKGIDFRLHIIGFGLKDNETEQLKCAAKAGDGQYYDAADAGGLGDVLNEATNTPVDEPAGNFSVFAVKNGKPVDAYVQAFVAGTKKPVKSARTYGDTSFLYLPAGQYDLIVKALEGSDLEAITLPNVQSTGDKINHHTISFDGGKIRVTTLNNGKGWDSVVKIYSKANGKVAAGGRTYGKQDVYEVNPGVYDVEVTAMVLEGLARTHRIENVQIGGNETKDVEHNYASAIVMIGAKSAKTLVDATVKIQETKTKKVVAGGRTYTSENGNPKQFILTPGTYEVTLTALGEHKGKTETITMVVKADEKIERIINF